MTKGDACNGSGLYFICYPTIAPSSLDFYAKDAIPGWENSLLMSTLKDGTVYRVEVTDNGRNLGESQPLWTSVNRYRDTAISPASRPENMPRCRAVPTRDREGLPGPSLQRLASIGLTIPSIAVASIWLEGPLTLGLGRTEIALLVLTVVVGALTVAPGRATRLQGILHLVMFFALFFLAMVP